jgi:hypothetical protein
MSVPNAHQSTPVLCPLVRMISGARYSGVPHTVHVLRPRAASQCQCSLRVLCRGLALCVHLATLPPLALLRPKRLSSPPD